MSNFHRQPWVHREWRFKRSRPRLIFQAELNPGNGCYRLSAKLKHGTAFFAARMSPNYDASARMDLHGSATPFWSSAPVGYDQCPGGCGDLLRCPRLSKVRFSLTATTVVLSSSDRPFPLTRGLCCSCINTIIRQRAYATWVPVPPGKRSHI